MKAFTLIELIFVIVILGILAAVAIPKLMATRVDANRAKLLEDIRNATKEVVSYYTANSGTVDFDKIKNDNETIVNKLINEGWVEVKNSQKAYVYSDNINKPVCLTYITNGNQIEVDTNKSNNDPVCKRIKTFINDKNISVLNNAVKF